MLRTLVLLALLDLGGCSGPRALEREVTGQPLVTACLESYRLIDDAVANAGVRNVEAHRVPGFPYLRVNRFLASFSEQDLSPARLEAWVDRLVRLDREGRTFELKNLPDGSRARLDDAIAAVLGAGWRAPDVVERCPPILRRHDLGRTDRQEALLARVEVPEDYSLIERALGVYPLTAIPVAMAWQRWEAKHLLPFRTPTAELGFEGAPVLYLPEIESAAASAEEVTASLERSRDTALGISEPKGEDLKTLAASFAPAYLVDTVSPADRIGHPVWLEERIPGVDTKHPVAFRPYRAGLVRWRAGTAARLHRFGSGPGAPRTRKPLITTRSAGGIRGVSDWGGGGPGNTWRQIAAPKQKVLQSRPCSGA